MAEWRIELRGDKFDLEELPRRFTSENLTILEDAGKYFLKSKDFAFLGTEPEVFKRGEVLLERINGTLKVVMNNFHSVDIESVVHIDDMGVLHPNKRLKAKAGVYRTKLSADLKLTLAQGKPAGDDLRESPRVAETSWPEVADQDKNVAKALRFFSKELDWINLYKIWEVVQEDQSGIDNITKKGWARKKNIDTFKQTANSYRAIGDSARHAREKHEPPPIPMPIAQARALIRSIVTNWIKEKAKNFSGYVLKRKN